MNYVAPLVQEPQCPRARSGKCPARGCGNTAKRSSVSIGRCNGHGKSISWCFPAEGRPWPCVEFQRDGIELSLGDVRQIRTLGEVLAQQAVGVLVGAALPRTAGITEVDLHGRRHDELLVALEELLPLAGHDNQCPIVVQKGGRSFLDLTLCNCARSKALGAIARAKEEKA